MITVEHAVAAIREVLAGKGRSDVDVHADSTLAELDLDSLDVAEVLIILEQQAGTELDESGGLRTVADLAGLRPRTDG